MIKQIQLSIPLYTCLHISEISSNVSTKNIYRILSSYSPYEIWFFDDYWLGKKLNGTVQLFLNIRCSNKGYNCKGHGHIAFSIVI